jgi:hypothetical protein
LREESDGTNSEIKGSRRQGRKHQQQEKQKHKMRTKIINYIRAGYPGLYLVSHEEQRVALEMTRIAQELKYNLVFWSVVDGLVDTQKGTNNSANDPLEALIAIKDLKEKTLILLRDFHLYMANWHSSGDWQFKQSVTMALPTVILKVGWVRCWAARFLPGCVAR